ncbi:MAG: hypothetical protein WDZ29_00770 [Balneolaceae bacterium]
MGRNIEEECPSCAMPVDRQRHEVCPVCGYEFPEEPRWQPWMAWLLILLMLLWLLL